MIDIDPINYSSPNTLSIDQLAIQLENIRKNKKVGLCSGSFDLLHPGHITHLESAKKACDILVVAVANDYFSMGKYKDSGKPVFPDKLRAYMVSRLKPVDFVIIDDGSTDTFYKIRPNVYIKGPDYALDTREEPMKARRIIESLGGKVHYTSDEKLSTAEIIKHIKERIK